jgi:hypothetical protein
MTSWQYILFNNPKNEIEFQDMIKKNKVKTLDIVMALGEENKNSKSALAKPFITYSCYPILYANGKKLELIDNSRKYKLLRNEKTLPKEKIAIQEKTLSEILTIALTYQNLGLDITLGKIPINEAKIQVTGYFRNEKEKLV